MTVKVRQRKYSFKGTVWKHKGTAGWYFVTLPLKLSKTIRRSHGFSEEGWGRLKAHASVNDCQWQTAIWFDSKFGSYLLPIKASVRKAEKIKGGESIFVTLLLQEEDPRLFKLLTRVR